MNEPQSSKTQDVDTEPQAPEAIGEAITADGVAALRSEMEHLEGPGRREIAERIKTARELGDLKENADYHLAKEDQAHLETRIKRLKKRLRNAVVVETDSSGDAFGFGRTAEVRDETTGDVKTWTLVGTMEADPAEGRLSAESPVGRALRNREVGESVTIETPGGKKSYRLQKLVD